MRKNFGIILIIVLMLVLPTVSFADSRVPPPTPTRDMKIQNPLGDKGPNTINDFIRTILEGAFKIGIPLIAVAIIYSGFLFVSAQGKTEKLETAKKSLTYTLIGAAILLGAWALAQLITNTVIAL